jgi:hypothetical protein
MRERMEADNGMYEGVDIVRHTSKLHCDYVVG